MASTFALPILPTQWASIRSYVHLADMQVGPQGMDMLSGAELGWKRIYNHHQVRGKVKENDFPLKGQWEGEKQTKMKTSFLRKGIWLDKSMT